LLILAGALAWGGPAAGARQPVGAVYVVQVRDTIDLGLAPYLARVYREAEREGAAAVLLEIDTSGGSLDAVLQMCETILASPTRTIAFVDREAFSAGALVAIAADEIYLAPGAVLGAATPVTGSGATASGGMVSAVRSTFGATAEQRGRDPRVAEAMVDPEVAIEGLTERGKLLTLTASQAVDRGYADGVAESRAEVLRQAGLASAPAREVAISPAERAVRFLTQPLVASLLFAPGILGILATLFSGDINVLTGVGLGALALFFWGHFLAGLAGWEGVALVALGLVLLAVEVFVIPGFGIAGVLGLAALLGGLFLSVTSVGGGIVTRDSLERGALTVAATLSALVAGGALLLWSLPKAGRFRGLVLDTAVGQLEPVPALPASRASRGGWLPALRRDRLEADAPPPLTGATGRALSDLRPGGFALIGGQRVDVVTQGDFIAAGEPVEVILDEGYRRVVCRLEPGEDASPSGPMTVR
ncbi:MAG: nodulation protein NfeD, partial [Chloroflexota bacterium]|nr:nodulation protein NfeD [Chloroflexota bacterium]